MAEEEEDYIGDLSQFVPTESPPRPKPSSQKASNPNFINKVIVSQSSKKRPHSLNWQERRKIKRESKQVEEDEKTLANIQSAIPQSNIGFKMLKQMGYTPGCALGKDGSGLAEPVGLNIRRSRAGIGRDTIKEKMRRDEEMLCEKRREEEELMSDFGCRLKEQWRNKRAVVNFHKAKGVLDQLENKEVVESANEDLEGENEGENEEGEEEEVITEEDLQEILMKLREEFQYCLFCGCQYETLEALLSNCPGINEDDH